MNYNVTAYLIYLSITIFIIVFVGKQFYRNGRVFILDLLKGDTASTDSLNKILLIAYYLFNIGYACIKLRFWTKITDVEGLVSSISANTGLLILILALTHYGNMTVIWYLSRARGRLSSPAK